MVSLLTLVIPIVLSAVIVFIASSIIHMVLPFHRGDFRKVPEEDRVMETLRGSKIPPGDYMIPYAQDMKQMRSPEFIEKMTKGPVAVMTVIRSGPAAMGMQLAWWFVYCLVVSIFAGYVAGRALHPGAPYLAVFRFAGCTAFIGYSVALWQNTIWYKKAVTSTLKSTIDGLIYAFLTAGTFGWLWPR
jgi:hypothetical protein